MLKTQNYGFNKPELSDSPPDITVMNPNWDTIDKKIKENTDAITQNSQEIGQKLDKESSFYADLEAYYGNTKLIDDFQDISKWNQIYSIKSSDTTNVKIGSQALKIIENDNISNPTGAYKNEDVDLTKFLNGETINANDYMYFVFYVSDENKINKTSTGVFFSFNADLNYISSNRYFIAFRDITTGWNFKKVKISEFSKEGTISWDKIKTVSVLWQSTANAQNAYVSFQLIQLVKADPVSLIEMPNPFQKFGVRELIVDEQGGGDEFCLYKGHNSPVKIITLKSVPSLFSFKYPKFATDNQLIFMTMEKASTTDFFGYLSFIKDEGNRISLFYNAKELILSGKINSVQFIEKVPSEILGNTANLSLEKRGNKYIGIITSEDKSHTISLDDVVLEDTYPYLGIGANATKYNSFSITEISHAHHSDISEVAKNLEYNHLEVPSIDIAGYYKEKNFVLNQHNLTSQVEAIIDLGNGYYTGILEIELVSSYNAQDSIGSIIKKIPFGTSGDNVILRKPEYTELKGNTKLWFSISDIYVEDGRKKIKIIQKASAKNFASIMLRMHGVSPNEFKNSSITNWKESIEPFIEPSMTPVETVITSGFASGWSGVLRVSKTQEGVVSVSGVITRSSDLITSIEVVYASLPKPSYAKNQLVNLYTGTSSSIGNSFCNLAIDIDGRLLVYPVTGTNLSGARQIYGFEIKYNTK